MTKFSRRSILGGMLSILAASTTQIIPAPAAALIGNAIPRIFADGNNYDSEGFQALFDGLDVIIPQDKLQISTAKGVIFHHGVFVIEKEVYTNGAELLIENATFDGMLLRNWECFFTANSAAAVFAKNPRAKWLRQPGCHFAVAVGDRIFSVKNQHIADQTRFRPAPMMEI